MKRINNWFLALFLFGVAVITSSCNGGRNSSVIFVNNQPINGKLVVGLNNNTVYQNKVRLDGVGDIAPSGDTIKSLAKKSGSNSIYVASSIYVYQSIDNFWSIVNDSSPDNTPTTALSFDNNNKLYVGTESGNIFKYVSGTWETICNSCGKNPQGTGSVISPSISKISFDANNTLYFLDNNKDLYTLNQFNEAESVAQNFGPISTFYIDKDYVNNIVIGVESGGTSFIYESFESSVVFNQINSTDPYINGEISNISSWNYESTEKLVLGVIVNKKTSYVYESQNGSWESVGNPAELGSESAPVTFASFIESFGGDPNFDKYGALSGNQAYLLPLIGSNWSVSAPVPDLGNIISAITLENISVGTDAGNIYNLSFGDTGFEWSGIINSGGVGTTSGPVTSIMVNNGIIYCVAGEQESSYVYKWSATSAWTKASPVIPSSDPVLYLFYLKNKLTVVTSGNNSTSIYQLIDNQWKSASKLKLGPITAALNISDNQSFAASYDGESRNAYVALIEGESNITTINGAIPDKSMIYSLAFDTNNNLYAGTESGNVYESGDGNWKKINTTIPDGASVTALITDLSDKLYAGTSLGNIYESSQGLWKLYESYPGIRVNTMAITP